jgi:hypothetical protein
MGLLDLICDVVEVGANVGRVVLVPVEVVAKGAKEITKVVADLATEAKDAITK